MEEKEIKSISAGLNYPNEDGTIGRKMMSIKINTLIDERVEYGVLYGRKTHHIYSMSFSLKIPDFIHSYLLGKTVPKRDDRTIFYPEDFSKTLRKETIRDLTKAWCEIVDDYCFLVSLEKLNPEKVIFYCFESDSRDNYKSYNDGTNLGLMKQLSYKYMIGYIINKDTKQEIRYNENKVSIRPTETQIYRSYKYVSWTPEREAFFKKISDGLQNIIDAVNDIDEDIENGRLDTMTSPLLIDKSK